MYPLVFVSDSVSGFCSLKGGALKGRCIWAMVLCPAVCPCQTFCSHGTSQTLAPRAPILKQKFCQNSEPSVHVLFLSGTFPELCAVDNPDASNRKQITGHLFSKKKNRQQQARSLLILRDGPQVWGGSESIAQVIPRLFFCVSNLRVVDPERKIIPRQFSCVIASNSGIFVCNWTGKIFVEAKKLGVFLGVWGDMAWGKLSLTGEVINFPLRHKGSFVTDPSLPGKTVHSEGKGKLFSRENYPSEGLAFFGPFWALFFLFSGPRFVGPSFGVLFQGPFFVVPFFRGPLYMGKKGSICHFPRALPASIWGHCSQVLVFTSTWGTRKGGLTMTRFVLFFPASGHLGSPKCCKTRETRKWQIDPFLPSHL